jgi:hypothetical protein
MLTSIPPTGGNLGGDGGLYGLLRAGYALPQSGNVFGALLRYDYGSIDLVRPGRVENVLPSVAATVNTFICGWSMAPPVTPTRNA